MQNSRINGVGTNFISWTILSDVLHDEYTYVSQLYSKHLSKHPECRYDFKKQDFNQCIQNSPWKDVNDMTCYRRLLAVLMKFVWDIIVWPCLTRTGNYQIHEFDWLKTILTAV